MISNKNVERCLWLTAVIFVTYLLLGSFIVDKNYLDLAYLLTFYIFILSVKIVNKK